MGVQYFTTIVVLHIIRSLVGCVALWGDIALVQCSSTLLAVLYTPIWAFGLTYR